MNIEALRRSRERSRILSEMTPRERVIFTLREDGIEPTEHEIGLRFLVNRMNAARTLEEIGQLQKEIRDWLAEYPEDDYVISRNAEGMHKIRLGLLAQQERASTSGPE